MMFGEMPDGSLVTRHRIAGGGLMADILSYGAVLQDLRLEGHDAPLVLGFSRFAPYLTDSPYFGAVVGRCANRIGNGTFGIDGQRFQTDMNFMDAHTLHGGARGTGKRNWQVETVADDRLTLRIDLANGEMGFPGDMTARVSYGCLDNGVFDMRITARSTAPTLCNFAHHSYWNLDGGPTTKDHRMQVDADHYIPVDDAFIPTGNIAGVAGTRFDFRMSRPIADDTLIDHNLCLSDTRQSLRKIGTLMSRRSGVSMEMRSTESGLQVYDGFKMNVATAGHGGRHYGAHGGVALEPQVWPDAINHAGFPHVVLRPGQTYEQHTQFVFSQEQIQRTRP